jgi:CDP-diacylglycerol--glycerol-3-phosphate 3-phosphatidyltransferase
MVVVILAREIWVTGLRGIAAADGIILAADTLGKWKSLLQMVAIPLLLLHDLTLTIKELVISGRFLGLLLLALSLVLSLWSGVAYSVEVFARRASRRMGPDRQSSFEDE